MTKLPEQLPTDAWYKDQPYATFNYPEGYDLVEVNGRGVEPSTWMTLWQAVGLASGIFLGVLVLVVMCA